MLPNALVVFPGKHTAKNIATYNYNRSIFTSLPEPILQIIEDDLLKDQYPYLALLNHNVSFFQIVFIGSLFSGLTQSCLTFQLMIYDGIFFDIMFLHFVDFNI